ncbi:MAG: extracellular solute-binding protein [Candidatus Hydrogenedentota bacterium]
MRNLLPKIAFFVVFIVLLIAVSDAVRPVPGAENREKVVEVAIFEGGYGIGWHSKIAAEFNEEHADRNIRIELWGDPRTADIIKPRLLRGDPPDLILDERLPLWLLIGADKLTPFTQALREPLPDSEVPWGDEFATGMLDMFTSDGEVYAIPAAYGSWTCWYDKKMFRDNGWEAPKSWDDFLALCREIEKTDIDPIALQGKYAILYGWNTFIAMVQRVGGLEAINRINALEPDAYRHTDVIKAARLFQELVVNHFQKGAMAMTHTESQLQFVTGKAAMIFCGLWLENEMKANIPPDFELGTFDLPTNPGWKGNPKMVHGQGMEFLFVPRDARYPDIAFEFARYLVSRKRAPDMAESIGVISPLAKATPAASVTKASQSALEIIDAADGIFNVRATMLFPAWRAQVMNSAIQGLCRGELTPEEFCRLLDEGIVQAVETSDLKIPAHVAYDPTAFGEGE